MEPNLQLPKRDSEKRRAPSGLKGVDKDLDNSPFRLDQRTHGKIDSLLTQGWAQEIRNETDPLELRGFEPLTYALRTHRSPN